ncbi:54S ribosomal protein L27 [Penicillium verhagenii]|uniref:54S ribosomal protein L27 n=1 Tax=Penicillium verhagenii TaxID=1562060 RepID=UPI0025454F2C|nr:54S ribosomal protein L27 [Penicillium verhagenii]KAJ5947515.1 54S ribosomal protein L27 [Penicillium verhagenii]
MLQPRFLTPLRALERAFAPSIRSTPSLCQPQSLITRTLSAGLTLPKTTPTPSLLPFSQVRYASHASQGTANRHSRDPAGKRLGAKRSGGEYVVPGCIIFKQRGSLWFPGDNCAMGRDHTIYATQAGYVRYYLDPLQHPDRKYIGVVFDKEDKLPYPRNAPSRRRLNMVSTPRIEPVAQQSDLVVKIDENGTQVGSVEAANAETGPQLRPGYMYREANWVIGRAAEQAGVFAKPYDNRNRWLAWRKRQARAERAAQMKSLKGGKKAGKKAAK